MDTLTKFRILLALVLFACAAHAQVVTSQQQGVPENACPAGSTPLVQFQFVNPQTGRLHNNVCVDANGTWAFVGSLTTSKVGTSTISWTDPGGAANVFYTTSSPAQTATGQIWSGGSFTGNIAGNPVGTGTWTFNNPVTVNSTGASGYDMTTGSAMTSAAAGHVFIGANTGSIFAVSESGSQNTGPKNVMTKLYNAAGTEQINAHLVSDTVTLAAGTATVTFSGAAAFTSATSYTCSPRDSTAIAAVQVVQNSGTSVTFNGTTTDVIRYVCAGT